MAVLTIDELREAAIDVDQADEWTTELLRRSDEVRMVSFDHMNWRESIADLRQRPQESAR